jgi:hypothetical protein
VLASPDIPAETLLSNRGNFLAAALSRFDEAFLFSNEGDEVLRQISTLANYFVFPTNSSNNGFRLGNVEILRSDYGLIKPGPDEFLKLLRIGNLTLQQLYDQLEDDEASRQQLDGKKPAQPRLPGVFTYFDCTDYVELDSSGNKQGLLTFALCAKRTNPKAKLRWYSHLHLLIAYVFRYQKPNVHGGYFQGVLSQQLIYRLACLGYRATVAAYGDEALCLAGPVRKNRFACWYRRRSHCNRPVSRSRPPPRRWPKVEGRPDRPDRCSRCQRTDCQLARAFSSEVETGSRQENASNQQSRAPLRFYRSGALGRSPFRGRMQSRDNALQYGEGIAGAVGGALLEIHAILAHRIGDMREAEKRDADRSREAVERRGFHLDSQNSLASGRPDRFGRLAKRSVRGPGGANDHAWSRLRGGLGRPFDKRWVSLGEFGRSGIMVAGALVAQRPIDNDEIGRQSRRQNLTGGGEADQQPAAAREQFFRHQNGERGANYPSDNADLLAGKREGIQLGMIARPARKRPGSSRLPQCSHQVAVGIQQAHRWHRNGWEVLLASGLAQQCRGDKDGRRRRIFVV